MCASSRNRHGEPRVDRASIQAQEGNDVVRAPETEPLLTSYGRVYVVTNRFLPFVKIGRWGSTESSLISRYKTVYGPDIELYTWLVLDERETENKMKLAFVQFHLSGELYHTNENQTFESYVCDTTKLICKIR